jgi:L-aspartate oxidase
LNEAWTPGERYLVDFDTRELPRYAADVLVVGGGIAGLAAAIAAAPAARVLVAMKEAAGASNTARAQGGIAAALAAEDSPAAHAEDTIRTGCGLCDEALVREVVEEAPRAIDALVAMGARLDRDQSALALGREGGHGARRIVHAAGDATGAECSRVLLAAARGTPGVLLRERLFLVDLLTAGGRCIGALARTAAGELVAIEAGSVIVATGGAGRLYRETTNVRGATGDGIAAAWRAGATLRDVEFVQFHPTTLYLAGSERVLVTEAVRGEGARVVDDRGDRFLVRAHPDAELAPRDVVSRAIHEHLARPGVKGVFLDLRHLEPGLAARRFPGLVRACARYGLDPQRDLVPVRPAAHYFIGGIACDREGRSDVPGLFACGEAACSGLHGANRLASNSLLEGLVLGARAGRAAAREAAASGHFSDVAHVSRRRRGGGRVDVDDLAKSLASLMWRCAGIVRNADGLAEAREAIARWRTFFGSILHTRRAALEVENMLLLGGLVVEAAMRREESRGTHGRSDFPARDDARFLGRFLWKRGAEPRFARAVPEAVRG